QTEIKDIQSALNKAELSDLERNAYINHLDFLFGRTHAIRNHLANRHLEVLLRNHVEIPEDISNSRIFSANALAQLKSSEYTLNQILSEYNLCAERIGAMKQQQEILNASLKTQLEKIEKYEETQTKFNNAIAKYHTSKTDGTYEKNAKAIEEAFKKNTNDLANLLNFLSGLYTKKDDTMISIFQLGNAINQEQAKLNPIATRKEKQEKIINEQKKKIEQLSLPMKQFFARHLPYDLTNTILNLGQSTLNVAHQSLQEKLIEAKSQAAAQEIENKRNSARQKQQRDYDSSTEELRHKKAERPIEERPAFLPSQSRRNDHRFEGGRRDHYPHGRSHTRREDRDTERRNDYRQDQRSNRHHDNRHDDRQIKSNYQSMIFS
ncbi:MAG TPA: hypothetical protein PLD88_15345, partial [Candidatus Berkiella sp.]|nr:hypothetical protein [Candidatus Berkiella sp.]